MKLSHSIFQQHIRRLISISLHNNRQFFPIFYNLYLNNKLEDKGIWNERQQAVSESNLLLIFSKI